MRDFLNAILSLIGSESLTDLEFGALPSVPQVYDQASYDAVLGVLTSRGLVGDQALRLSSYYTALGANFTPAVAVTTGRSNIFVGGVLE